MNGKLSADFPSQESPKQVIYVDQWDYRTSETSVICPVGMTTAYIVVPFGILFPNILQSLPVDVVASLSRFMLQPKKGYKSVEMKEHLSRYISYFTTFYDPDQEYFSVIFKMKVMIDRYQNLSQNVFFDSLERYILRSNIFNKVVKMTEDNYTQDLDSSQYRNYKNPELEYSDSDAKILHIMSILMNLCIPLLTHYAYVYKLENSRVNSYLMQFYDKILLLNPEMERLTYKLYNTISTNILTNERSNKLLWAKQDIRGIDTSILSERTLDIVILNIIPKYKFTGSVVSLNHVSTRNSTRLNVNDVTWERKFTPVSSSNRDSDCVSDMDRFEANLIRMNEGLERQNQLNCDYAMNLVEKEYGPFDSAEIDLYVQRIATTPEGDPYINHFQRRLISGLFFKYFKDTQSLNSINRDDYIKLVIAAKKALLMQGFTIFPYIISGKIVKLVNRKSVNKHEKMLVENSPLYPKLINTYRNPNITMLILSDIATIIASTFVIVDMDPQKDGQQLAFQIPHLIEEIEMFMLLCCN